MSAHDFAYVQSDVPEGVTLTDWRKGHGAPATGVWRRFLNAWRRPA